MARVVVVDDETLIRMYITEVLQNNGYDVVGEAEDGLDAINICRQMKPDIVIMDIRMPVLNGLEAAKVIKDEELAGFVIVLTAYNDKEMIKRAVEADVMGYVIKPVNEASLISAIEVAQNKFEQIGKLEKEFAKTKEALNERKFVDRAKGLIMEQRSISENEAYAYIRKLAMNKGMSIVEVSKTILQVYQK